MPHGYHHLNVEPAAPVQSAAAINNPSASALAWRWRLFALASALLDPILGLLACVPNVLAGVGDESRWCSPRRLRRGLIIILGGIEGPSIYQRRMAHGLLLGGWRGAVRVQRWNRGAVMGRQFVNLMSRAHHERESDAVVNLIRAHRRNHPDTPVGLLSLSGGCWIAVRALEKLAPRESIDRAVLLAAAISPVHDLSRAASGCRRGLTSVRGHGDAFYLGLGTSLLGTSDRRFGPSGGWLGWRHTPANVTEMAWRPQFIRLGYLGNHTSAAAQRFIAAEIAPLFTA